MDSKILKQIDSIMIYCSDASQMNYMKMINCSTSSLKDF